MDGFTGNVVLKASETAAELVLRAAPGRAAAGPARARCGRPCLKPAFEAVKRRSDPAEIGGAPLLGLRGCCVIGHGKSSARAIEAGIRTAASFYASGVNAAIESELRTLGGRRGRRQARGGRAHEPRVRVPGPGLAAGRDGAGARRGVRRRAARSSREADAALGFPLSRLCFEGPEAELQLTANTQPAILATSIAALRPLVARGVRPDWVAGHSLGRVLGARGRRVALARGRAPHRAPARPVHAGGGARRTRGDGGDPRARARRDRGRLPRGRAGRGGLARERELAGPGRDRRPRGGRRAGVRAVQGQGRQAGRAAAGVRALPLRADAAGAGPPGSRARGPRVRAIPSRRS